MAAISLLWRIFNSIGFHRLILRLLFNPIIQDKALAALAIEDKKRQYAASEKYLEDMLQSWWAGGSNTDESNTEL